MPDAGTIVLLDGTSSSGKTSIALRLQEILDGHWVHSGIDHWLERVAARFHSDKARADLDGLGLHWVTGPDGLLVELRYSEEGYRFVRGMYRATAAFASAGNNVIFDDVMFDERAVGIAAAELHGYDVLFVRVCCDVAEAEQRELERGDRTLGTARAQAATVHSFGPYDLEVDTTTSMPDACALAIKEHIESGGARSAFARLSSGFLT